MRFFWITCFILSILSPYLSMGQTIGIRGYMDEDVRGLVGHVSSDKGGGVPYAHVFFMHGKDTIPLVCDAIGSFSWSVARVPDTLQVRVTAIGFKTLDVSYSPKNQGNRLYIRMQQEAIALNEVIITAKKVYMVVKGDTLEYKADAFKTLEGDFVGNLLKKMPGVSYEDGSLSVNGEPIYRVYVNGENLGGKNTVLNNIRADNVKDIQVYDERNKEDQAKGMKYGRRETVMNLVTKQKVTPWKEWRNDMFCLGMGWDISEHQTSRFKQKWNLNFGFMIPLSNDSKTRSGKNLSIKGNYTNIGKSNDVQSSTFSLLYKNRKRNFVTVNDKLFFQTNNKFTNYRTYTREIDNRIYFPTSVYTSRTYDGRKEGKKDTWDFTSINLIDYKKIWWTFTLNSKKDEEDRSGRERSEINDSLISCVNMQYHNKNLFSSGKSELTFFLADGVIFKSSFDLGQGTITSRQIDTLSGTNRRVFLEQEYDQQKTSWETSISYGKTLSLYSFAFGYKYISSMNKEDGKSINHLTSQLDTNGTRDYTFYQQKHNLSANFRMSTQKMDILAKITMQYLLRNRVERFPHRVQQCDAFWPFDADLTIKKKNSPTFNWEVLYNFRTSIPMIHYTRREIETSNPMFLRTGNPNLKPQKTHEIRIHYNRLFVSNASHIKGYVYYTRTDDFYAMNDEYFQETTYLPEYDYTVMAGATLTTPRNTKAKHNLLVSTEYSKYSGLLESKLSVSGLYKYTKTPSFTQGILNDENSNSGTLIMNLTTAFSRKLEFVLYSKTSVTNTQSDLDRARNILEQGTSLTFRTSFNPKLRFSTTFSYNYSKNYAIALENGVSNLKMAVSRDLGKFASLLLEGINLLDRQSGVSFEKNAVYSGRTEKAQTGRYVMLTFTQKLR